MQHGKNAEAFHSLHGYLLPELNLGLNQMHETHNPKISPQLFQSSS